MLFAGALILYTGALILYQCARLLALNPFLVQHHPIDEIVDMPGICYGTCATYLFWYSWLVAWCVVILLANFERLRALLLEQKERNRDTEARDKVKNNWNPKAPYFYFMPAHYVRELAARALPRFQELRRDGILQKTNIRLSDAFCGEGGITSILFISHRWEEPGEPDKYGYQLAAIKEHLDTHSDIEWVWYDYSCMPQPAKDGTDDRTVEQKTEFGFMLTAIADLYMTSFVLILLDKLYDSRFWTLTESWCAMQQVTMSGLRPAVQDEERYTIKCIHDANDKNKSFLVEYVRDRSEREMRQKLAMADVNVTNMKDKETMLPIIQKMDEHVVSIMQELKEEGSTRFSRYNLAHPEEQKRHPAPTRCSPFDRPSSAPSPVRASKVHPSA